MNFTNQNFNQLQKILFKAAKEGNINAVKECINAGAVPSIPDEHGHDVIFYLKQTAPEKMDKFTSWFKLILLQKIVARLLIADDDDIGGNHEEE